MISLINQFEDPKAKTVIDQVVIDDISEKIESCLNRHDNELVDIDGIKLSINYDKQIEIENASIEVYMIMEHINTILSEYVVGEL